MKVLWIAIGIVLIGLSIFIYFTPPYNLTLDFISTFVAGFLSALLLVFLIMEAENV